MRLLILICFCISGVVGLYGQTDTDVAALNSRGKEYLNKKMFHEAEAVFLESLQLNEKNGDEKELAIAQNSLGVVYWKKGNVIKADSLFKSALEIRKRLFGEQSLEYAETLNDYARFCGEIARYDLVEEYLMKAIGIRKEQLGMQSIEYAESINNLGQYYLNTGKYEDAKTLLDKAEGIYRILSGENSLAYAESKLTLGSYFYYTGDYDAAEKEYGKFAEINRTILGENHPDYASALFGISTLKSVMNKDEEVEPLLLKSNAVISAYYGKKHPIYAGGLSNLGAIYYKKGDLEQAESILQESMQITQEILGKKHSYYFHALNCLALIYKDQEKYEESEALLVESLNLRKGLYGDVHMSVANTVSHLAELSVEMKKYEQAELLYEGVLIILKSVTGESSLEYAVFSIILSSLKATMGKYPEAVQLSQQACPVMEQHLGEKHPYYVIEYANLGQYCLKSGDFQQGEPVLLESMELTREVFGEEHVNYIYTVGNLGLLYSNWGLYEKAEPLLIRTLELRKEVLGERHPDVATAMNNLATFYKSLGNYKQAEKLLQEGLDILESSGVEYSAEYGQYIGNLALIYSEKNDYTKAAGLYEKALAISKSTGGEYHPDYLTALNNYTEFRMTTDSVYARDSVELILKELLTKRKQILGETHKDYIISVNNLGHFYDQQGKLEEANMLYKEVIGALDKKNAIYLPLLSNLAVNYHKSAQFENAQFYYTEILRVIKEKVTQDFIFLTEQEQEHYWDLSINYLNAYKSFCCEYADSLVSLPGSVYNSELFFKALLLNSSRNTRQCIVENGGGEWLRAVKAFEEIILFYENSLMKDFEFTSVAALHDYLLSSKDPFWVEISEWIDSGKNDVYKKEKEIISEFKDYEHYKLDISLQWEDIQKALKPDEAAIEFLNFVYYNFHDGSSSHSQYCALLLRPDSPYPQLIDLGTARELEKVIRSSDNDPVSLYSSLWEPIEKHLNGITGLYIAPAGLLHHVSFAGIKKVDHYVGDDYRIHNLLSTKDIIRLKEDATALPASFQIALFGGADYSLSLKETIQPDRKKLYTQTNLTRSVLNEIDSLRGPGFSYLPGSKKEVVEIDKYLTGRDWKTMLFVDREATETSFKSLSAKVGKQSPEIIHISTHGFSFPEPTRELFEGEEGFPSGNEQNLYRLAANPLMRSGLAFAGANYVWKGNDPEYGKDDGILTAYEISGMNLFDTELVVLSACNTGLGDINYNEGVYGLQRAFRLAGVQTMIVSLWEVPDKETVELMTAFYSFWGEGMTKKEAFDKAQMKMRHTYPDHPEKWAGFVMIE